MTLNDYKNSLNKRINENNNKIDEIKPLLNSFGIKSFAKESEDAIILFFLSSLAMAVLTSFAVAGLAPTVPVFAGVIVAMWIFSLFALSLDYKGYPNRIKEKINGFENQIKYYQSELDIISRLEAGETLSAYSLTNETKVDNFSTKNSTFDKNKRILKNIYLHTTNVIMENDTSLRVSL